MDELLAEVRAHVRLPEPEDARAIRLRAGVAQTRLAQELGVDRVTVARWERGTRHPRGRLLEKYVELLEMLEREVEG